MPLHRVGIGNVPDSPDCVVVGISHKAMQRVIAYTAAGGMKQNFLGSICINQTYIRHCYLPPA